MPNRKGCKPRPSDPDDPKWSDEELAYFREHEQEVALAVFKLLPPLCYVTDEPRPKG